MRRMIANYEPQLITISEQPLTIGERFRANVRRLMGEQSLSQAGLAERLTKLGKPMNRISLNQLLGYAGSPQMAWLELMARALDVDEESLIQKDFSH